MERQKEMATPREAEMPRPELYWMELIGCQSRISYGVSDGVFLWNGKEKVVVREPSNPDPMAVPGCFSLGHRIPKPPTGPKYTGPLTPELLANILIYG